MSRRSSSRIWLFLASGMELSGGDAGQLSGRYVLCKMQDVKDAADAMRDRSDRITPETCAGRR